MSQQILMIVCVAVIIVSLVLSVYTIIKEFKQD